MPTIPKPDDKQFELTPEGNHIAVCYRVIDLGTQHGEYLGKPKVQRKILISWELPDEKMSDGRPFTIGQKFTWSMSEMANLRQTLESWRGKAFAEADFGTFDIASIIGVGCMLNVVHVHKNGKTYSNIASVAKLPKGMSAPAPSNPRNLVWLTREDFIEGNFNDLTEGLKAMITPTQEYKALFDREQIQSGADNYQRSEDDEVIPF